MEQFDGHENSDTFRVEGLSKNQVTVACLCINMAPGEERPWANAENLRFFTAPFVRESVELAIKTVALSASGIEVAETLL